MMGAAQLRGARALLGMDQRELTLLTGLSMPTIQRMEASKDIIRGNVDSLMKLIVALDRPESNSSRTVLLAGKGGRGVRLTGSGRVNMAGRTDEWKSSGSRAA